MVRELSRGAALALVTNGLTEVQRERVQRSGWSSRFTALIISEELGVAKPHPGFFQAALDALGLPAEELLCVGDNPVSDVGGAQAAGIDACWYSPSGAPWSGPEAPPVLMIRDLRELLAFRAPLFPGR